MEGLDIKQLESLQSKDQAALLDIVDEIRNYGVNRYISLPQLIVCGDQSSGKSSVLEAVSGVHFPVNDGLCTRFTTEVILRRAPNQIASVKVIPAKDATREHKEKLFRFKKQSVGHNDIPELISEAKTIMGLTGNSTFSRDILQLEVSGPKLPHLTLVDLPGLIHNPNKEQTLEDVKIPRELVQKYMQQPRSIVLAIVSAKNDKANQIVLELAKAADPQGLRTMGIITKPDFLKKDTPQEASYFGLANNKDTYLKLGWHVLRNGDYDERKDENFKRDEVETEFFASGIWKNLPSSKLGVASLRTRLSQILFHQIQRELPDLIVEINNELTSCKTTSDRLGPPRDTPLTRRSYLTKMAERFHGFVNAGTEGYYQDSFFKLKNMSLGGTTGRTTKDELTNTRLRARLRQEEVKFTDFMHERGHSYEIVASVSPFATKPENGPVHVAEHTFLERTRELLKQSKGRELAGTFNPLLVGELFVEQSRNWESIASNYVSKAWEIVKGFLDDVLSEIADETVRSAVLEEVIDPAMEKRLLLLKGKVGELLSPYQSGHPSTLNRRFLQLVDEQRAARNEVLTKEKDDLPSTWKKEDPDIHACRDLLHLMQAYYAVALDVFVDNVASLAVENCLIKDLKDLFSPTKISEMTDDQLELIAAESDDIRELRQHTLEKQAALTKSLDVCRRQEKKIASTRLSINERSSTERSEKPTTPMPTSTIKGSQEENIPTIKGLFGQQTSYTVPLGKPLFGSSSEKPEPASSFRNIDIAGSSSFFGGFGTSGSSVLTQSLSGVNSGEVKGEKKARLSLSSGTTSGGLFGSQAGSESLNVPQTSASSLLGPSRSSSPGFGASSPGSQHSTPMRFGNAQSSFSKGD